MSYYVINNKRFKSKPHLGKYIRAILYNKSGYLLKEGQDFVYALFITDIAQYAIKRGKDVISIRIGNSIYDGDKFGTKCFILERKDGTEDTFSFTKAVLNLKPVNVYAELQKII
jgi:hypothetical protein